MDAKEETDAGLGWNAPKVRSAIHFSATSSEGKKKTGCALFDASETPNENLDEVVVVARSIFVMFQWDNHEDEMVSLCKPAGFTMTASDPAAGLTRRDIVRQARAIMTVIGQNPDVFKMRKWTDVDRVRLVSMWVTPMGWWTGFLTSLYS